MQCLEVMVVLGLGRRGSAGSGSRRLAGRRVVAVWQEWFPSSSFSFKHGGRGGLAIVMVMCNFTTG